MLFAPAPSPSPASTSPLTPPGGGTFLLVTDDAATLAWLTQALWRRVAVVQATRDMRALDERIGALRPQAVLIDFSGAQSSTAAELHRQLRQTRPDLPTLGVGASTEPATLLSALRAGVADFVDIAGSRQDLDAVLAGVKQRGTAGAGASPVVRGHAVAVLGARPGLGVTTLATHLALLLQDASRSAAASGVAGRTEMRGVALLDLGWPARDGLLYLDTPSDFSFVDGMNQLRRLDQTLAQTALARHTDGLALLPLPSDPAALRAASPADAGTLLQRLPRFFDHQIVDLGGCPDTDFIAQAVREADRTWVVCDQSIGGLVSTARLLRELNGRGLDAERMALVVNLFDSKLAVSAQDIATRLELPLEHVLPHRRAALLTASAQGGMLARVARRDPYVGAVRGMVRALQRTAAATGGLPPPTTPTTPAISPWAAFKARLAKRTTGV